MTEFSYNAMPTSEWCPDGFEKIMGDLTCAKADDNGNCINWVQYEKEVCKTGQTGGGNNWFANLSDAVKKAMEKENYRNRKNKEMSGGADPLFDMGAVIIEVMMFFVFLFAFFYTIYLVAVCNNTIVGFLYELMVGILFPFFYIPYAHFVKSCSAEFIWSWISSKIGSIWAQILAVITSYFGTLLMLAPIIGFIVVVLQILFATDCENQNENENVNENQ